MQTSKLVGMLVIVGAALGAASCDDDDDDRPAVTNGGTGTGTGTGAGAGGGTGTDPGSGIAQGLATFSQSEVASVVLVVNQGEVTQGQIAQQRASTPEVRAYAERMVAEHTQAIQRLQTGAIAALRASVSDPTAAVLARQDQLIGQDMQSQSGTSFDLTYMTTQVAAHAKVLGMIDRSLLPSTVAIENAGQGDANLRNELTTTRTAVSDHLNLALQVQQRVRANIAAQGGSGTGGGAGAGAGAGSGGTSPTSR
jgi:putative membrane protein